MAGVREGAMIGPMRFAVAACAVVFALHATASAASELHPLEAYEGGSKQAEDRYSNFLVGFFGRHAGSEDVLLRGTHAVGTCTEADVEILDIEADADVPDDLAIGVFAEPRTFAARVRFSNGLGTPSDPGKGFDDKDYDARAMAFQIRDVAGQPQDFVLQNSPIFPIWPVQGFALTVQLGIAKAEGRVEEFMGQLDADQRTILSTVLGHVRSYQRSPGIIAPTFTPEPDAYRLETYWSGKAHQLGTDGLPVKYIAKPCTSNGIYVPTKAVDFENRAKDFLQEELRRHLEDPLQIERTACFGLYVQPLRAEAMTGPDGQVLAKDEHWKWVEDTTLEWKETEAPAYQVGKISLKGPVVPPEICDDPGNFINSSINTLPEHEGLGRISRAETIAAKASIERRAGGGKARGESNGQDD
jgi:catalase